MNKYRSTLEIAIAPLLSVLVVVLLLIFGIKPSLANIFDAQRNFTKNQERLTLLNNKANELAAINQPELRSKVDKLSLVIPAD